MEKIPQQDDITIGTSIVVVSLDKGASAVKRKALIITNVSTGGQIIRVGIGTDCASNKGLIIYQGGSIERIMTESVDIPQGRITAISNIAGGELNVYEEVMDR